MKSRLKIDLSQDLAIYQDKAPKPVLRQILFQKLKRQGRPVVLTDEKLVYFCGLEGFYHPEWCTDFETTLLGDGNIHSLESLYKDQ